jgi:hypothetical protein
MQVSAQWHWRRTHGRSCMHSLDHSACTALVCLLYTRGHQAPGYGDFYSHPRRSSRCGGSRLARPRRIAGGGGESASGDRGMAQGGRSLSHHTSMRCEESTSALLICCCLLCLDFCRLDCHESENTLANALQCYLHVAELHVKEYQSVCHSHGRHATRGHHLTRHCRTQRRPLTPHDTKGRILTLCSCIRRVYVLPL